MGADRLDLRHVGRGAVRGDGRARPAGGTRGVRPGASPGGDVPSQPTLAAPAERPARLRVAGHHRRAARTDRRARRRSRRRADRARGDGHGRHRGRARRAARVRAHLLEPVDADRRDGPRRARIRGDQRARPAGQGRRRDRNGRRMGAQLPARACVRQPWRRRDHRVPLRLTRAADLGGEPGSASPAARAVPRRPARARPDRRSPRGGGASGARGAAASRRHDRPPHAGHRRTQHGARGALGDREGRLRPSARRSSRGRACNRPAHRSSVASQGRGGGGPGALRRGALPVPARPGAPGDHRPGRPRRARARRELPHRAGVAVGGEAGPRGARV